MCLNCLLGSDNLSRLVLDHDLLCRSTTRWTGSARLTCSYKCMMDAGYCRSLRGWASPTLLQSGEAKTGTRNTACRSKQEAPPNRRDGVTNTISARHRHNCHHRHHRYHYTVTTFNTASTNSWANPPSSHRPGGGRRSDSGVGDISVASGSKLAGEIERERV